MPRNSGAMTARITLEVHDTVTDAWIPFGAIPTIWASAEALGNEQYILMVDYRADLVSYKDSFPAMRARHGALILEVIDIVPDARHEQLRISAQGVHVEIPDLGSTARQTYKAWP